MTAATRQSDARAAITWATVAFVTSSALILAKFGAWWVTESTAILSDALESIINVVTSGFALYAVWLSARPRDEDHPYGHGKVEYVSAAIEGALILSAAVAILVVAVPRFWRPSDLDRLDLGAALISVIGIVTLVMGTLIRNAGRRLESPTIEADGAHLRADAVTTFGVLVGVILVRFTGVVWLDPLTAVVVAGSLVFTGIRIMRTAVGGLMDEADPALLDEIGDTLARVRRPGWVTPHHAKVHRLGQAIHVDMHLVFPRYWSLSQAHDASEEIEAALQARFGERTEAMVHMEPCTDQSCTYCDAPQCPVRAAEFIARRRWDHTTIARTHRAQPLSGPDDPSVAR